SGLRTRPLAPTEGLLFELAPTRRPSRRGDLRSAGWQGRETPPPRGPFPFPVGWVERVFERRPTGPAGRPCPVGGPALAKPRLAPPTDQNRRADPRGLPTTTGVKSKSSAGRPLAARGKVRPRAGVEGTCPGGSAMPWGLVSNGLRANVALAFW